MEKRVSFEKFVKKVGKAKARAMYLDNLSEKEKDKFGFDDWVEIYYEVDPAFRGDRKKMEALNEMIVKKIVEKAEGIEQTLQAYQKTKDGSQEEKMALEKLSQFKYPEDWLEIFERDSHLFFNNKGIVYFKEKIEGFVEFP